MLLIGVSRRRTKAVNKEKRVLGASRKRNHNLCALFGEKGLGSGLDLIREVERGTGYSVGGTEGSRTTEYLGVGGLRKELWVLLETDQMFSFTKRPWLQCVVNVGQFPTQSDVGVQGYALLKLIEKSH